MEEEDMMFCKKHALNPPVGCCTTSVDNHSLAKNMRIKKRAQLTLKQKEDRDRYLGQLQCIEIKFDDQLKSMLEKEFGSSELQVSQSDKTDDDLCPGLEIENEKKQPTSKQRYKYSPIY